ncbi:MAG: diguanylate cyclase [Novosphingobium sp.]|nr:diguanylate cyclase [Novosphingobium sp.]
MRMEKLPPSRRATAERRRLADIRGWPGLRAIAARDAGDAKERGDAHPDGSEAKAARRDLVAQIGDFLLDHDLEITPANLATAHAGLSGSNPHVAERLARRQFSGEQIDQQWLDGLSRTDGDTQELKRDIEALMDRLECSVSDFSRVTHSARAATGEYRSEFGRHMAEVERVDTGASGQLLLQLSRAMLQSMHKIEDAMTRSHDETAALRDKLAEARREAESDYLTGLPNRRAFERRLDQAFAAATQRGTPLCVAFCDVDHFKQINDNFGHDTGDRVLQAIARLLKEGVCRDCFVARHGGEEFALIFAGLEDVQALAKLDRARGDLAARKFIARREEKPIGRVTFSAGLANVMAAADPRAALAAADAALYRAKREGRNRVILA